MDKIRKKSSNVAVDRRVLKTKQRLSGALVSLIQEKGYAKVTIQDILDRSNVGRSTFYLHYENKEQLLLWGHDHLKNLILADGESHIDFLAFYRHLAEVQRLALAILSQESGQVVTRYLEDIFQRNVLRLYPAAAKAKEDRPLHGLRAEAAAAALVRLMTGWLRKGMPCSPESMAREASDLLENIFAAKTPPRR